MRGSIGAGVELRDLEDGQLAEAALEDRALGHPLDARHQSEKPPGLLGAVRHDADQVGYPADESGAGVEDRSRLRRGGRVGDRSNALVTHRSDTPSWFRSTEPHSAAR